ncbi:MAG: type IV secretory system conjugative DNA transfer family protein [Patulibacter sp.]|nr:type IV secretory system conjugative DNA transfer family protein [Patulibacter sp.]
MSSMTTLAGGASRRLTSTVSGGRRLLRRVPTFVWVTAAAIATAAIATVELTGAIAGMLHSHHPALVSPTGAIAVLEHWLGDTGVRRGAWPAEVAPALGKFHQVRAALVVAVVLVAIAAAGCLVMWRSTRVERLREIYKHRGARWAKGRELARLQVRRATPGRLTLGTRDGKLLASEVNASTLIVAPAQAGKTSGLAVPAMVEWDGPILATSVKGDLLVDTFKARQRKGEVRVFDPTGSTMVAGSSWSPVAAATSWSAARRLAASILQIGMRQHGGQDDSFWRQAGAAHLAPLLFAGNYLGVSTAVVLTWATSTESEATDEALRALRALNEKKTPGADRAEHDLQVFWKVDTRYRSNVIGTLSTHLDAWKEPALEAATSEDAAGLDITPEWLLDGNNTLYLSAPADAQRRLRGLFCALVTEVVAAAFARAARTGRPLDPRLLLMMDEAANIAPLPNIDEIASTGPGQGVLLCTILQNLSQAEEVWGKDRADTILANHRARLFGSGIGDTATLEYINRILGDEVRETASISRKRAAVIDLGSRSESLEHRALLGHHETRQIKEGHTLLVYGQLPPTQLQLRPWFKDARLRRLVAGTAPASQRLRTQLRRRPQLPAWRPANPFAGRGCDEHARPPRRKLGLTVEVQLGERPKRQLSIVVQGTQAPAAAAPDPSSKPVPVPVPVAVVDPVDVAEPAPVAAAADQLQGQLTLDQVVDEPAPSAKVAPPATSGVKDVRHRLDRHLGEHAAQGVAALRLAANAGDHAALTGPHALVLLDADAAPASAAWNVAELLADEPARKTIAERMLQSGAACQTIPGPSGTIDRWTAGDDSQVDVRMTTDPQLLAAIADATPMKVDGVGELRIVSAD